MSAFTVLSPSSARARRRVRNEAKAVSPQNVIGCFAVTSRPSTCRRELRFLRIKGTEPVPSGDIFPAHDALLSVDAVHAETAPIFRGRGAKGVGVRRRAIAVHIAVLGHQGDQGAGGRSGRQPVRAAFARPEHHQQGPPVSAPCEGHPRQCLGCAPGVQQTPGWSRAGR